MIYDDGDGRWSMIDDGDGNGDNDGDDDVLVIGVCGVSDGDLTMLLWHLSQYSPIPKHVLNFLQLHADHTSVAHNVPAFLL